MVRKTLWFGLALVCFVGAAAAEVAAPSKASDATMNASGANAPNGPSLKKGLVGYWTFDNADMKWTSTNAGVARDSSGNDNALMLTKMSRATSPVVGKFGQALKFNGSSYVSNLSPNLPAIDAAITISAWLSTGTTSNNHNAVVLNNAPLGGPASTALQLSIRHSTFLISAAGGGTVIDSSVTPSLNTWYLVTFTFDGTTNRIYVNGVEKAANRTVHQSGASSSFWIGTYNGTNELWTGSIDDVRIYNRALAANEVKRLFMMAR